MALVALTQADSGKAVRVHVGDTLVVRLPENPTTGYRWVIDQSPDEAAALTLKNASFAPAAGTGVGGGGERTFTFTASQAREVSLRLSLQHPWEGDRSATDRYSVPVRIES